MLQIHFDCFGIEFNFSIELNAKKFKQISVSFHSITTKISVLIFLHLAN